MQSIEAMLRTVPGFAQLDSRVLERVAANGDYAEATSGDVLFREGATPACLYVLLDGQVSLTGTAADTSSTVIDVLGPRSSFVLANVLADEPYLMGAEAVSSSLLVTIAAAPMREVVNAQPAAALAMMRAMSAELGSMTQQVVDLKARIAAQRLGAYLLSLVKEPTAKAADFRLPVSKGLLAPWLGCRAENLSRAFMALRAFGVETHGSRVMLHDISRLRAYAGACLPAQPSGIAIRRADAAEQPPVEKVLGDAFMLRSKRPRRN
jgi:CRP/FNR family transcriptional activator FtrB